MSRAIASFNPADKPGAGLEASPVNLLPVDGEVFLIREALSSQTADRAFSTLMNEVDWRQETATLFGRRIPLPRLTAWYGDHGYAYSGIRHDPASLTPTLTELKTAAERAAGQSFNSVLINLYRDGRDSMGWHSDDEKTLGAEPVIASLSLGGTRRFQLKHRREGNLISIDLPHGSGLIMQGRCQACWRHQIPKTKKRAAPRINLTFRYVHRERTGTASS